MPTTKSAKKSLKQIQVRTLRNLRRKRIIKDLVKKSLKALEVGETDKAKDLNKQIQKAIDKATKTGVFKKNTASRKKSRLTNRINKASKK